MLKGGSQASCLEDGSKNHNNNKKIPPFFLEKEKLGEMLLFCSSL